MINFIRINRFKTLLSSEFRFTNLNIFSGLNGMGKSSVIQVLLLLRQSFELNSLQRKGLVLNGKYASLGVGQDVLTATAQEESIEFHIQWNQDQIKKFSFLYNSQSDIQPTNEAPESQEIEQFSLFNSLFQYLSADRIPPKSQHEVSDFNVRLLNSIGNHGEYAVHYISEYGKNDLINKHLQHKNEPSKRFIENLNAWMSDISPGIRIQAAHDPKFNIANLTFSFKQGRDFTNEFKPQNVGFGLSYVLPVIVAILRSKPGDLLIIENPESHLHPAGQSAIGRMCSIAAEAGVQIIIETHSDHFLNGVRVAIKDGDILPENVGIHFLQRSSEDEHSSTIQNPVIDKNGRIDFWPSGFFDEWEKNLEKLF